jgi:hypothetical protein
MYMFSRGLLAVAWREGLLPGPVYRSTMEPFAHIADIEGRRPAVSGLPNHLGPKTGRFCPGPPALPRIKGLGWTKTHDKTFAVLGGFWHDAV